MESKFDKKLIEFVALALSGKNENVDLFKAKFENKVFEGEDQNALKLLVVKGFDPAFSHLVPLGKYLVENDYCKVDNDLLGYALTIGLQMEMGLRRLQNVESSINGNLSMFNMLDSGSVKLENKPIEQLFKYSKNIVLKATDEDIEYAKKRIFSKGEILTDIENYDLFKRDDVQSVTKKIKP